MMLPDKDSCLVLALETSTSLGSIALVDVTSKIFKHRVRACVCARVLNTHGESILPHIEYILRVCSVSLNEVDILAVSRGPGSFTGTRVGVAMAKGLALGANKPLVGVDVFCAWAAQSGLRFRERCGVAINAYKGEVYTAIVEAKENDFEIVSRVHHVAPEHVFERLERPEIQRAVGDAAEQIKEWSNVLASSSIGHASAISIASIAGTRWLQQQNLYNAIDELEPLYIRPPDITVPKPIQRN